MDTRDQQQQAPAEKILFTYSEVTSDVEIEVSPAFLIRQSKPDLGMYTWSYEVSITNHGARRLQLLNRHWIITDGRGVIEEVKGRGVVGEQPILLPTTTFRYSSGCPLRTPTGNMRGWYEFVDLDSQERFKAKIPLFFLRIEENLH
jgi:ApaG protein